MTRPKVPDELRQRVAQACESCKRRKQKCDGNYPCALCQTKGFECIFKEKSATSPKSPSKRVRTEFDHPSPETPTGRPFSSQSSHSIAHSFATQSSPFAGHVPFEPNSTSVPHNASTQPGNWNARYQNTLLPPERQELNTGPPNISRSSSHSGHDEAATIYSRETRILKDSTGRPLFIGDSSTLAFLQMIRYLVEDIVKSAMGDSYVSQFVNDVRRHRITEARPSKSLRHEDQIFLPDWNVARVLVESFFSNTPCILRVFKRHSFDHLLSECYEDPLQAPPERLSLLNIVFAIGLTLVDPSSYRRDNGNIRGLDRISHLLNDRKNDWAELFYLKSKTFSDTLEDADFWSVQALLLMSYYLLSRSRRNACYAHLGMAIRSAYSLGLNREESMRLMSHEEKLERKDTFRTLFILDQFVSCQLGRPTTIDERQCTGDVLNPSVDRPALTNGNHVQTWGSVSSDDLEFMAIEAALRASRNTGEILKQVYSLRKVSTKVVADIAETCRKWPEQLPPQLQWPQTNAPPHRISVAIKHIHLMHWYSLILLTRPYVLHFLGRRTRKNSSAGTEGAGTPRRSRTMHQMSEACVSASLKSVALIQDAFKVGHVGQKSAFAIPFLFNATLVLLCNEFSAIHALPKVMESIEEAIRIMKYCALADSHAERLADILEKFKVDVIAIKQRNAGTSAGASAPTVPSLSNPQLVNPFGPTQDSAGTPSLVFAQPGPTMPAAQSDPTLPVIPSPVANLVGFTPVNAAQSPSTLSSSNGLSPQAATQLPTPMSSTFTMDQDPWSLIPKYNYDPTQPETDIDFDSLWECTQAPARNSISSSSDIQAISDSMVPLYGVEYVTDKR